MMKPTHDYIAVGPHGVYAITYDLGDADTRKFVRETIKRGHKVERVLLAEAVARHKEFLAKISAVQQGRAEA